MIQHYLLWAVGPDHPGIVARLSQTLFKHKCNLEDSSMMRLGAEFGIILIFTSQKELPLEMISGLRQSTGLTISLKKISQKLARFKPLSQQSAVVTAHGADRPGLVFRITEILAKFRFNITDLSTHRTAKKGRPGYILFIEGEMPPRLTISGLKKSLQKLERQLKVHLDIRPLNAASL